MCNKRWIILGVLALFIVILLLFFISGQIFFRDIFHPETPQPARYRFAFVCGDSVNTASVSEYWRKCIQGIRDAAEDENVSVSFMDNNSGETYSDMKDVYDSAILSQMDGVICVGFAPEALRSCIDQAMEQGIPTICLDGDVASSQRIAYVGTDNYGAGIDAAQAMLEQTDGGCIHVVYPNYTTPQFIERVQGFTDRIAQEEGYTICIHEGVIGSQQLVDYSAFVDSLLRSNPDTVGIFCPGTHAVITEIAGVLQKQGMADGISIICFDDYESILQSISAGDIDATIAQQPYEMGVQAVKLMCSYIENGSIPDETVYVETYSITPENVAQYMKEGDGH